jgi:3-deoxy-D-manno-octulosonate 8-phosphate phosphatase (KDO 8-P phosphatase)
MSAEMAEKLKRIKLVALDVDGVLTDGRLMLGEDGTEFKAFYARDGFGIRALLLSGIEVAVITGRESEVVKRRCAHLGIKHVYQNVLRKCEPFEKLMGELGLDAQEACFVGDDVNDLALLKRVGLSVCVADGAQELKEVCDMVTERKGGRGAVREVAEKILKTQGKWEKIVAEFS